ncbi:MAG: YraN family protein [Methylobacteriaceae bacterium]|jgi:putative endonuclease|nr:YraN family protein [Methylobacteriaceae bacterium]
MPERSPQSRRRSLAYGRLGEVVAMVWLMGKGYRPVASRFTVRGGEVDLIMRRGKLVVFVEVKARAARDAATYAITPVKRRRFNAAVRVWLSRNPRETRECSVRADAVFIGRWKLPLHIPGAFDLEL